MLSKVARYISASLIALCAAPLFWASPAEATFVSCAAGRSQTTPFYGANIIFSAECESAFPQVSTDVAGQASAAGTTGVQSRLTWATNTTNPHAYAFGYNNSGSGMQAIPGCLSDDTTVNGNWAVKTGCSLPVHAVALVVRGD